MKKIDITLFDNFLNEIKPITTSSDSRKPLIALLETLSNNDFDTKFDFRDFKKPQITSNKYSNDIGFPEWIGI